MAPPLSYPFQSLGFVSVTTAGTPVPISATTLKCRGLTIGAFKAKGVANAGGNVYVQDLNGNVLFVVPKGTVFAVPISHPQLSEMIDLSALYLDADTSADGALITALL